MSTDRRQLGDPVESTEPSDTDDSIGTPAAAISTTAVPDEVDIMVDAVARDMVAVRIRSSSISGKIMVEPGPARQLADDLLEAADRAELDEEL